MTAPLILLGYAVLLATVGPPLLRRSSWPDRSPGWGLVVWQALTASVLASVALAGVALAVPTLPWTTNVAALIEACGAALRAQYETPAGAVASLTGGALAAAVVTALACSFVRCTVRSARARRRQRRALALLAHRDPRLGALVLDHPTALAYCVPGRPHEIVITTGALAVMSEEQLSGVLAHEQAHLRGRHSAVLTAAEATHLAFPWVPAFREAHSEIGRLLEMRADDVAARRTERTTLAAALVQVAQGRAPQAALGAGGDAAVARVRRLLSPVDHIDRVRASAVAAATGALLATPVMVLAAPALSAAVADYCPLTWGSLV